MIRGALRNDGASYRSWSRTDWDTGHKLRRRRTLQAAPEKGASTGRYDQRFHGENGTSAPPPLIENGSAWFGPHYHLSSGKGQASRWRSMGHHVPAFLQHQKSMKTVNLPSGAARAFRPGVVCGLRNTTPACATVLRPPLRWGRFSAAHAVVATCDESSIPLDKSWTSGDFRRILGVAIPKTSP